MSEGGDKPKRKRKAAARAAWPRRRYRKCPVGTLEKIMPYVDAIEHYHLAHTGEGVAISEFRMSDEAQEYFEAVGGSFADTYVVSGATERRLFRLLADQLRERNGKDIRELVRLSKLEQPVALPPAASPDET
jgi:hypothetical protein